MNTAEHMIIGYRLRRAYHWSIRVGPVVPIRDNSGAGRDSRRKLSGGRHAVVVAGNGGRRGVQDWVTTTQYKLQ